MDLQIKKHNYKNETIPFSFPSGINKNKFIIEKIPKKINNYKKDKNGKEKELYNYELDQSLDNNNLTNSKKIHSKIKFENILEKNKNSEKNEESLISKLNQIKREKNILKNKTKDVNNYSKINKKELKECETKMNKVDLIKEYNNLLNENKKIKKNLILQQILINEMKNDIENSKLERSKNKEEVIINENNNTNGDDNYKNILQQKNNLIRDLQNENMKLSNENLLLKEKLNNITYLENIIESLYENIKLISIELGNFNKANDILIDNDMNNFIKYFMESAGNDNNGIISNKNKINIINKFNDFIKSEIEILLNHFKEYKIDKLNSYKYSKKGNKNFNDLFISENGINIHNKEKMNKTSFFDFQKSENNIKLNFSNFKYNDKSENSLLKKYKNNRYVFSNTDLGLRKNSNNKMRSLFNRNRINLKKKLLEKDYLIFKSNLISNSKNSLNDSREDINTKVKELNDFINQNNKKNITIDSSFIKKNKKIKIPTPNFQINKISNFITPDKIKEKNFKDDINNNEDNERNAKSNLERIKTDININDKSNKFGFDYIKLNVIFQNLNNSNILSAEIEEKKRNKNNLNNKYINSIPKLSKIKNNINKVNGLAKEVMKPSFLKTNISLSMNNDNNKDKDNFIFKGIKKYEIDKKH